jgi:hypothetical protein
MYLIPISDHVCTGEHEHLHMPKLINQLALGVEYCIVPGLHLHKSSGLSLSKDRGALRYGEPWELRAKSIGMLVGCKHGMVETILIWFACHLL